ncbi:MAG: 50S ribosomal protein L30 [Aeromicrobium sp.]|uniref:50S ribosomal protein L30 n=1 Tax=Aeromicrobium sp. TaxID=1871063 RepID=UPI0039E5A0E1
MAQLKITQVKSAIGRQDNQRQTLRSLGLKRIGDSVVRSDDAVTRGYVNTIRHLLDVQAVSHEEAGE